MSKIVEITGYDRWLGPIFEPGSTLNLKVKIDTSDQPDAHLFCEWELTDMWGQMQAGKADISKTRDAIREVSFQIPLKEVGAFDLEVRATNVTYDTRDKFREKIAVIPHPPKLSFEDNSFGVNLATHTFDGMKVVLAAMKRFGIGWGGLWNTLWFRCEKAEGKFDWSEMDGIMDIVDKSGVKMMGVLGLAPSWAIYKDENGLAVPRPDRWEIYCRQIVSRYKDRIKHWQLWNEPDISGFGPWENHPVQCAKLLALAYPVIKQVDPTAQVLSPGIQGCKPDWMKEFWDAGGAKACDIGATHAYWGPDWKSVAAIIDDLKGRRPGIKWWITEMGKGLDDRALARFVVRNWLKAVELGAEKILWHCVSQGEDGFALYYRSGKGQYDPSDFNYGVGAHGKVTTGLVALANLTHLLPGAKFVRAGHQGKATVYEFAYEKGGSLFCVWSLSRPEVVKVPVKGQAYIVDMVGKRDPATVEAGHVTVPATADPVFVVAK